MRMGKPKEDRLAKQDRTQATTIVAAARPPKQLDPRAVERKAKQATRFAADAAQKAAMGGYASTTIGSTRLRRLVGMYGPARPVAGQVWYDQSLHGAPSHEMTSPGFTAMYPFWAGRPTGALEGAVLGLDVYTGTPVCYDPFLLYQQGTLTNPSLMIVGDVGSGKSTQLKMLCRRGATYGRRAIIIDPKSEYGPLVDDLGGQTIVLDQGNPERAIRPLVASSALVPRPNAANTTMVLALLAIAGSERAALSSFEQRLVELAVADASGLDPQTGWVSRAPSLDEVAERVKNPTERMCAELRVTIDVAREQGRDVSYLFDAYISTTGSMYGLVNGSQGWRTDAPILHIDVSRLFGNEAQKRAFSVAMLCSISAAGATVAASGVPTFLVLDEAWAVLTDPQMVEAVRQWLKLARSLGVSVMMAVHKLSDLKLSGRTEAAQEAAGGLLADIGTIVVGRQKPSERRHLAEMLALAPGQIELALQAQRGRFLWRIDQTMHLVDVRLAGDDARITNTDAAMQEAETNA